MVIHGWPPRHRVFSVLPPQRATARTRSPMARSPSNRAFIPWRTQVSPFYASRSPSGTYGSGGDGHLDLAAGSPHKSVELGANALEERQSVVLSEGLKEALDVLSAGPVCFWSSAIIWLLSSADRVGACMISPSLASVLKTASSLASALETESRVLLFTAAVYCLPLVLGSSWIAPSIRPTSH